MTRTSITIGLLLVLVLVVASFFWANRPRRVIIDAPIAAGFPEQGFSHDAFEVLLRDYVTPAGQVDYDRWHASADSLSQLDGYLAAVSEYSPDNTPDRFPERNDALAYWLYGYNAYVIKAVLDRWPLSSVTDIKAPIEAIKGMGFFYQLRFSFGGKYLSLLVVENDRIRARYKDARIHFVLNCASESCPVARPELPTGDALEEKMEISGPVEITLFVGSSAKDTDFTVKLIDVAPDGTAWNLDETIQRVRYREGYDREVFLQPGEVYELKLSPMVTSATFDTGHRIRIEVSSSNFPRFARNLNTGGNNYDEKEGVIAINSVHYSGEHTSRIVLPVVQQD